SKSNGPSKVSRSRSSSRTCMRGNLATRADTPLWDRHRRPGRTCRSLTRSQRLGATPAQKLPPDEEAGREKEDDDGHPEVRALAEEVAGRVDTEELLERPPERVVRDVEGEQTGWLDAEACPDEDQESCADQVVDELVQEGGMEGRVRQVSLWAVIDVDLEAPREAGRLAEELLVEPVAPAPDPLSYQQPRRGGVREERDALARAADDH